MRIDPEPLGPESIGDRYLAMYDNGGKTRCEIGPCIPPEPGGFGILLVDAARHFARAMRGTYSVDGQFASEQDILAEVLRVFDAERARPTSECTEVDR